MIYSARNLSICSYWYDRPLSGGDFLDQSRAFLERVLLKFPELSMVRVVRDPKLATGVIDRSFSNFDREVIAALPEDWVFINSDAQNKKFTRESTAATAFPCSFLLSCDDGERELTVRMMIGTARRNASNNVIIEISPEFESAEIAMKLLELCVDFWRPDNAFVGRTEVQRLLNQPVGSVRIGWVTYLSSAEVKRHLPNDIHTEFLPPGILIYSSDVPSFGDDARSIETMRKIMGALDPHGFLKGHSKQPGLSPPRRDDEERNVSTP